MTHESLDDPLITDHKDTLLYMALRRMINGQYAEEPLDFNEASLWAGQKVLGRTFTPDDLVIDIGSSSGEMIANAAVNSQIESRIICIEPDNDDRFLYQQLPNKLRQRVSLVQAKGESLPLKDNAADGATLHNVIFRAQDANVMLQETKRVVKHGGFIAISSNARWHAFYRHEFERLLAEKVAHITGATVTAPKPPADGNYLEDLPCLVEQAGGLEIIDELYVEQNTQAVITRGTRLENYLDSIRYSAANTDLPGRYRWIWRRVLNEEIRPFIEDQITRMDEERNRTGTVGEPYFSDPIRRGMFVIRNVKSA